MRSRSRQTITYRLHAQRAMLLPSIMLRRTYLEKVHLAQIRSEKDAILGHVERLQPGVREEYLRSQRLRIHDTSAAQRAADLHLRRIHKNMYDRIVLQSKEHAEYMQTRNAALTNKISKKAVGI